MLLVALAVYIEDGGPILFLHSRVGRGGNPFFCIKFRSMRVDADRELELFLANNPEARREWSETRKLRSDPRITRVGAFIRKYSLDEFPQFFNVLRGDMSLVGPRPIVVQEVPRYGSRIRYYYAVRPGLTGLWQVSGRNDTSYQARVAMDVVYVRKRGLALDMRILAATLPAVVLQRGSY